MRPRVVLSIGNFFFALFAGMLTYIIIPFLTTYMSSAQAGLVIAGGALFSCILFPFLPSLVTRHGAQRFAITVAFLELVALFGLTATPGVVTASLCAALAFALIPFIAYELDLLLEATVAEENITARVRTIFLTAWNLAGIISPLILGYLLTRYGVYDPVFIASAAAVVVLIVVLSLFTLPTGTPPHVSHMTATAKCMVEDRDLAAVTFARLLLYLFFIWAPFYTPLYLHEVIGIPWRDLGWIFAIMLIPYVVIEYPAGLLADRYLGDKKLMLVGFVLAGGALASIGLFYPGMPLATIAAVLVMSRVGAALVESMTESHFFRRVSERDVNSISIFRGIWPLASLIGPVAASLILSIGDYASFFIVTGSSIAIIGVVSTTLIRDLR